MQRFIALCAAIAAIWFLSLPAHAFNVTIVGPDGSSPVIGVGMPIGSGTSATSGNVVNATAAATLPAVLGKTNYVTGIEYTGFTQIGGQTIITATLTGLAGGTLSYLILAPPTSGPGALFTLQFSPPLPASAPNTAITFSVPALGTGSAFSISNIHGFVL